VTAEGRAWATGVYRIRRSRQAGVVGGERYRTATHQGLARFAIGMQSMHMRRIFLTDEAKKKLWRPCREARAQGL
jgi:hypothetical protein